MVKFQVVNTQIDTEKNKALYDSSKRVSPAIAELKEIGNYRHLLAQLIRRDILTRYKRSFLGVAWTMLNPLGTMLVMTIVFSNIFRASMPGIPFSVYILSGLVVWNFYARHQCLNEWPGMGWEFTPTHFRSQNNICCFCCRHGTGQYYYRYRALIIVMLITQASAGPYFLPSCFYCWSPFFTLGFGLLISSWQPFS